MDRDAALMRAWSFGEGEDGWSEAVMAEVEQLLPILVEAGYVETKDATWNFTAKRASLGRWSLIRRHRRSTAPALGNDA